MTQGNRLTFRGAIVASFRSHRVAASAWLSSRYPFVWRTRALLWLALGLTLSVLAAAVARTTDIRTEDLPGLESVLSLLWWWVFLLYSGLLLLLVDVVRRTTPIFSTHHAVRVFGCVAVPVLALLLPQYVFMRTVLPRVAALETESRLAALLKTHGDNRFWRCWSDASMLLETADAHHSVIEADLRRYGLTTDFRTLFVSRDCLEQSGEYIELIAWRANSGEQWRIRVFEDRLLNIDAAQKYVRHAGGAYQAVALGHVWAIVVVAAVIAALASLLSSTMVLRTRTLANARRLFGRWRWHSRIALRLDNRLASRWPTAWSSRIHASLPQFLTLASLIVVLAQALTVPETTTLGPEVSGGFASRAVIFWTFVPTLLVLAIFWVLRTQAIVRHLPTSLAQDIGVLLIHAATVIGLAAMFFLAVPDRVRRPIEQTEAVALWFSLILCGALQAARNSSVLTTFGAFIVAAVFLSACGETASLLNFSDTTTLLMITGPIVCAALLSRYTIWMDGRLTLRRVLIGSVLIMGPLPLPGAWFAIMLLDPGFSDITFRELVPLAISSLASAALCLWLTRGARRTLACAGR